MRLRSPNNQAHRPGRETIQRQRQAGQQHETNHVAGSGAATGCCWRFRF